MAGKTWQTAAWWLIRFWCSDVRTRVRRWISALGLMLVYHQQRLKNTSRHSHPSFISALSDAVKTLGFLQTLAVTTVERRSGTEKNNTLHFCTRAFIGAKRLQVKETNLYKEFIFISFSWMHIYAHFINEAPVAWLFLWHALWLVDTTPSDFPIG